MKKHPGKPETPFLIMAGGSLDAELDTQSPFHFDAPQCKISADGRAGVRVLRCSEIASGFPHAVEKAAEKRGFLRSIAAAKDDKLSEALAEEVSCERSADRDYWKPLRQELEQFRYDLLQ